jgi:multidrug efflux system membrane fusion protein
MKPFRIILPIIVIACCFYFARRLMNSEPEPRRWGAPSSQLNVEASPLKTTSYQVIVTSQGVVRARTESTLIPEVAGRIISVAQEFQSGGFFEKGEILVTIDPSDYETALIVAQAALTQAESALEQEDALTAQALENWTSLGDGSKPTALALRKPQLAQAQAVVASAKARVEEAQRNLKRTEVTAPYAGRILDKQVDVGQYVSPGAVLASIYAIDYAEIRLPLSDKQLAFVDIPDRYRGDSARVLENGPKTTLRSNVGRADIDWEGTIVRTEGAFDTTSRQLFVIAQVDDPYGRKKSDKPPLKVGQFVVAEIEGAKLENVFVIPRSTLRKGTEILIIDDANKLFRRSIDILWSDENYVVTRDGLKAGELLCLTQVPFAVDGALCIPDIEGKGKRVLEGQGNWGGKGKGKGGKGKGGGPGKKGGAPSGKGAEDKSKAKGEWSGKGAKSKGSAQ